MYYTLKGYIIMDNIKRGYKHGIAVASIANPIGDQYPANFVRGVVLYATNPEAKAKRAATIVKDKADAHAYLLSRS